jgi:hypothetical protein
MLKPNGLTLVPRILNKLYDRVKSEIGNNKFKLMLLNKAIASKESDRLKYDSSSYTRSIAPLRKWIFILFKGNYTTRYNLR